MNKSKLLNDVRKPKTVNKTAKLLTVNTVPNEQLSARCTVVSFTLNSDHNVFNVYYKPTTTTVGTVFTRERPMFRYLGEKIPMSDSDV